MSRFKSSSHYGTVVLHRFTLQTQELVCRFRREFSNLTTRAQSCPFSSVFPWFTHGTRANNHDAVNDMVIISWYSSNTVEYSRHDAGCLVCTFVGCATSLWEGDGPNDPRALSEPINLRWLLKAWPHLFSFVCLGLRKA